VCFALYAAVAPALARADEETSKLTAESVATRAERANVDISAQRARIESAAADLQQALVALFPRLQVVGRYSRLSPIEMGTIGYAVASPTTPQNPAPVAIVAGAPLVQAPIRLPYTADQFSLQAALVFPVTDYVFKLFQSHAAARQAHEASELELRATRLRARLEAKLVYYAWVRAALMRKVVAQSLASSRAHAKDVERGAGAATASRIDVLRANAQVAQVEQLEGQAKNAADRLWSELTFLMGGSTEDAPPAPPEEAASTPAARNATFASLWEEAKGQRLELQSAALGVKALDGAASAARAGEYPRIDLQGELTSANPNARYIPQEERWRTTWSLTAQVSWSPNEAFFAAGTVRAAEAKSAALDADRRRLLAALHREVSEAVETSANADQALLTADRRLEAAEEGYRVRALLAQTGRSHGSDLADAETDLVRARLEQVSARIDVKTSRLRLEHAVGRDRAPASGDGR
jgi:outer membrane protein TolC